MTTGAMPEGLHAFGVFIMYLYAGVGLVALIFNVLAGVHPLARKGFSSIPSLWVIPTVAYIGLAGSSAPTAEDLRGDLIGLALLNMIALSHSLFQLAKARGLDRNDIPTEIRVLSLIQYALAFIFLNISFFGLALGHRSEWSLADEFLLSAIFSVLSILTAIGYTNHSPKHHSPKRGFAFRLAFGAYCVATPFLYLDWHGRIEESEGAALVLGVSLISTLALGVWLLTSLEWRFWTYFGHERLSKAALRLVSIVRWTGLMVGSFVFLLFAASLLVTTVFPAHRQEALDVVTGVADAVHRYRAEHGEWPSNLDQIDPATDLTYRWNKVEYVGKHKWLELDVKKPWGRPDLFYRFTLNGAMVTTAQHFLKCSSNDSQPGWRDRCTEFQPTWIDYSAE